MNTMKKTIIAIFALSITFSCIKKLPMKNGDLTGMCGTETVGEFSGQLCFVTDSTFTRDGDMYLEHSGQYFIKSDTLFIKYGGEISQNGEIGSCSQQLFVLTSENCLKIVMWKVPKDSAIKIPHNYGEIELSK